MEHAAAGPPPVTTLSISSAGTLQTLRLPHGGTLGWREYGDPQGEPVVFLHGWPSSSAQGIFLEETGRQRGMRVLAVDRPGLGGSSRIPDRGFLHLPPLVDELADSLGIGKFRVLGVSGGGPYALACAWALPHRILQTTICCGAPPLDSAEARRRFWLPYRAMLAVQDRWPLALQALLAPATLAARVRPPWPVMRLLLLATTPRDREALARRDRFDLFYPSFRDAMRSGWRGIYEDGRSYAQPWPFDPAEIQVPVSLWHGTMDKNFHHSLAERLASRIPGATFHLREEGHYSLPFFCMEELVAGMFAR